MAKIQSQNVVEELSAATFNPSTGSTGTLVAGTTDGNTIKVAGVYVSSASALTVTLIDGTTATNVLWEMYCAAGAPGQQFMAPPDEFLFACSTGEDLTAISSTNGAVFLSVLYQSAP
jgi:hypothetical protein